MMRSERDRSTAAYPDVAGVPAVQERIAAGDSALVFGRLTPILSGIAKGEPRQITLSVNDLQFSCRTSYYPSVA
jgi:hypothetical protein